LIFPSLSGGGNGVMFACYIPDSLIREITRASASPGDPRGFL
jgi:hypothetical protein